ncbi:OsmC family protein [Kineobactrum salinum]|uniref:OsmC family protein n=1 Tax=Kineobactrum salinum TaxID=2708301 RepID=A0A6C0U7L9_9GAMM|nr:OsmC family protein [Kineobactrum salinum]QIB66445.1 OsmC family protein [Kineobactrum salinum]
MKRSASAVWRGGIKDGKGSISTQSGVLEQVRYGFSSRFAEGPGTNPEELIAAAHAGCFTMAVSAQLEEAGMVADCLETTATVTLDKVENDFRISAVHLVLFAQVPGAERQAFETLVNQAKDTCPVSRVLDARITLECSLEA